MVLGGAGMGKSTLARAVACRADIVERFGCRRGWVPLDRADGPEALLAAVQEALALPAEADPWAGIEARCGSAPALWSWTIWKRLGRVGAAR